jgi:hypothetical protein
VTSHQQRCFGLQKAVITRKSADGTRGKSAVAILSADLQRGQRTIGGKNYAKIITFALDFIVVVPLQLVGTLYSPS